MSETFQDWVQTTLRDYEHRPGMITGRLHPLTDYKAQNAAKLAWGHQQKKIDELVDALKGAVRCMETDITIGCGVDLYYYAKAKDAIAKAKGEQE